MLRVVVTKILFEMKRRISMKKTLFFQIKRSVRLFLLTFILSTVLMITASNSFAFLPIVASLDIPGRAWSVDVSGDYAYVLSMNKGLQIAVISEPENPAIIGSADMPNLAFDVDVSGGYAYVASGTKGLQVIDIEFPEKPTIIGWTDTRGYAVGVYVSGSYAYVADGHRGLKIIDVTNPENPLIVGSINTNGWAKDVYVSGSYAYVADGHRGLKVIDITDPENPLIVGSINTNGWAKGVYVSGSYAYVADGHKGFKVIDITEPENPAIISSVETPHFAWNVSVSDRYAYVADEKGGIQVVDITDCGAPSIIESVKTQGRPKDIYLSAHYAYVADSSKGLQIIDISSLSDSITSPVLDFIEVNGPKEVFEHSRVNYTCTAYLDDSTHFNVTGSASWSEDCENAHINRNGRLKTHKLSSENELCTITVSYEDKIESFPIAIMKSNKEPRIVSSITTPTTAMNVYVKDSYAYVIDFMRGLYIIDINNPSEPVINSSVDTSGFAIDFYIDGSYAYIVDGSNKLRIVDISDTKNPSLIGSVNVSGQPQGVSVSGTYAYVASGSKGLQVVDVSDSANPSSISSLNTSGQANDVYVSGTYAYIAAGTKGLQVVDINAPENPSLVASLDIPGQAQSISLSDTYAYVASGSKGLQIVDIRDPKTPTLIASLDTPGQAIDLYVINTYVFIANVLKGLQIVDISDPKTPTLIASLDTPGQAVGVCADNTYAFIASGLKGLQIIDISMFVAPQLLSLEIKGAPEIDEESNGHYICTVLYNDDTNVDITDSIQWNDNCVYGDINTAGELVTYEVSADESCSISALYEKITAAYDITIKNVPKVVAVKIIGSEQVNEHTGEQYTSVVVYNDGTSSDVSSSVLWNEDCIDAEITDNGSLMTAEVNSDIICSISVSYGDSTQSQDIVIKDVPKILSIEISGSQEINELSNAQYTSTAYYSDSSTSDITDKTAWTENCSYASITAFGLLSTGKVNADQLCTITAVYGEYSDTFNTTIQNVSDDPFFMGLYNTPGYAQGIYASDSYALVADGVNGLIIIDISEPHVPSFVSSYNTPAYAHDIAATNTHAFVADGTSGLLILNISNPQNISLVSAVSEIDYANSVYVSNTYAYVAYEAAGTLTAAISGGGLTIIDISDIQNPVVTAVVETLNSALDVFVSGNFAYVVEGEGGFDIVDITDPLNPSIVGFIDTPGFARGISVSGDYAYIADGQSGIQIVNITDPFSPVIVKTVDTPFSAMSVSVSGDYAYVADGESGLQIIDITTPNQSFIYSSVDTYDALDVFLLTHFAYVADGANGLQIIDIPFLNTLTSSPLALGFVSEGYIEVLAHASNFDINSWPRLNWSDYNSAVGETHPVLCDVDGDNKYEMIVGLGQGSDGWLEIKDDVDTNFIRLAWLRINWPDYNTLNGETFPACGDLDGDGKDEIAVGLGSGGGGWIQVFDDAETGYAPLAGTPMSGGWVRLNWSHYNTNYGEIHPAIANVDSDESEELVLGLGQGGEGWLQVLDDAGNGFVNIKWLQIDWPEYNTAVGESRPTGCDLNGDGRDEIVVGLGTYSTDGGWVKIFDSANNFNSLGCVYDGWVHVDWPPYNSVNGETFPTCGDIDSDSKEELILGFGSSGAGWYVLYDDCSTNLSVSQWRRSDWNAYNQSTGSIRPALGR
jgi:hypothetical protein